MRYYKLLALTLAALLAVSAASVGSAAKKKKTGPVVVGTDPEGDWGGNVDPTLAPIGEPLGQDLLEAAIEMPDKETVNFIIKLTALPAGGGMPEITRYTWDFVVSNGGQFQLDGKFTNYTRGACDPTSGSCPPPQDPGPQPFLVRGNCASNGAAVACENLGTVQGEFDAGAATITIPVPAELISVKKGSVIGGATQAESGFSGVSAAPSAFYSHTAAPYDTMPIIVEYKVPKR